MSASLVGSEMCIRDSDTDQGSGQGARTAGCLSRAEGPECKERARRREAVSYTHLTLPTICSV
eukprot:8430467-Alexandrium_andersonii.AAC.1